MRVVLAMTIAASFAFTLSTTSHAATITVNSLADPGRVGICALRDAITAANIKKATHGCAAGTGNEQIQFSVRGTILLGSTLPKVIDRNLTINGPASPGIKIDGGGKVQVMQVALGAKLNLTRLGIANGNNISTGKGGGIDNEGTLTVTNSTFSSNDADFGGGIFNEESASLKSTILASSANSGNCSGTITDAGYNISDDMTCGFVKTSSANNGDGVNLLLSPAGLANNGGPTQTIALLSGSPAIDAIPLAHCTDQALPPKPIHTDQRGFPRPDAGEVACDIGAYEFQDQAE